MGRVVPGLMLLVCISVAGCGRVESASLDVSDMPAIEGLGDPLFMNDGSPVKTKEQWARLPFASEIDLYIE